MLVRHVSQQQPSIGKIPPFGGDLQTSPSPRSVGRIQNPKAESLGGTYHQRLWELCTHSRFRLEKARTNLSSREIDSMNQQENTNIFISANGSHNQGVATHLLDVSAPSPQVLGAGSFQLLLRPLKKGGGEKRYICPVVKLISLKTTRGKKAKTHIHFSKWKKPGLSVFSFSDLRKVNNTCGLNSEPPPPSPPPFSNKKQGVAQNKRTEANRRFESLVPFAQAPCWFPCF